MPRFSNPLFALALSLSGCLVSHQDQALVVDACAQDDAGASDASVDQGEVHSSTSGRVPLGHASQAENSAVPGNVPVNAQDAKSDHVANSKDDSAAPVANAQVAITATTAQAQPGSAQEAPDGTNWQREVVPASLTGIGTKAYDPSVLGNDTCRGVMTEGQLCTCLTGTIDPEYADSYGATCSHRALGVPGFGVFTDRSYSTYVTVQKDGGWYKLTHVDSAGFSSFEATGARLMRAGKLPVLAIQMSQSSGCTNDSWDLEVVQLCALRDLDSAHFGRCVTVPVKTVFSTWIPETDKTVSTRSRVGFGLTPRGTVMVYAKGKIRHAEVKKSLGEHKL
jgi:hypothetical protein